MPATPPPTLDGPQDVPTSAKERGLGALGGILSAGGGRDASESPLMKAMAKHHQQRIDEAQKHYKDFQTYTGILATGIDPDTNQPLKAADAEKYYNLRQAAGDALDKTAGVNKDIKGKLQKLRMLADHIIKMHPKAGAGSAEGGGGQDAGAGGGTPSPRMTPPPSPTDDLKANADAPRLRQEMESQASLRDFKAREDILHKNKMEEVGNKPEKYEFKTIDDGAGGQKIVAVDKTDPTKPYIEVKSTSGATAKPGAKQFANDGKLEIVSGIPTGRVMHGGKYVAPGQSGYTKEDESAVKTGLSAQGLSDKEKEKLAGIRGAAYAKARAAYQEIPVVSNTTGESTFASLLDIANNPGEFVQPGEAEKIAAREAVHTSLKANFGALDKDLASLEKKNGLDGEVRTQVQLALRTDNPGMLENMLVTGVKQGYSDEVLRYITDIKAMQEDILVLRNVGGMGQGSDMMRSAMIRLIPGPGTSSVKEARLQMEAAQRTSESLFRRRPTARFSSGDEIPPKKPRMTTPPKPGETPAERTIVIK